MGLRKLGFARVLLDPKPGWFLDSGTYVLRWLEIAYGRKAWIMFLKI